MKRASVLAALLLSMAVPVRLSFADVPPPPDLGTSGTGATRAAPAPVQTGQHANWTGRQFVFMHFRSNEAAVGTNYSGMTLRSHPESQPVNRSLETEDSSGETALRYDKFAGKIVTCMGTSAGRIVFREPTYGVRIYATPDREGCVPNIAPLSELEIARRRWVGKTVFGLDFLSAFHRIDGTQGRIELAAGDSVDQPLKIVGATWGTDWRSPVWLLCACPDGTDGFYAIAVDTLNKPPTGGVYAWSDRFFDRDPTLVYHCSQATLNDALEGQVDLGMSEPLVTLAFGDPDTVNTNVDTDGTHEQWVYDDVYVYFDNGVCSAVDDRTD